MTALPLIRDICSDVAPDEDNMIRKSGKATDIVQAVLGAAPALM
jgi:hypothetical protein